MKIKVLFFLLTVTFAASYSNIFNPAKPFVVVLDAGHGGHDPGNRGNGLFEKDIALDIILKTGEILEKNPSVKVIYTRKTDVFVDLFKRGQIANQAKADLFVSVHCNAHNTQAYGTETFVLGLHANNRNFNVAKQENSVIFLEDNYEQNYNGFDPNSPESVIGLTITQEEYLEQSLHLASFIQDNFTNQLNRKNRGVKQAGFVVLHQTVMPSVLIETGFLSNLSEGKYLNSSQGKSQMASSIAKAILDYKKSQQQSFEINTPAPETVAKTTPKPTVKSVATEVKKDISPKKEVLKDTKIKVGNGIVRKSTTVVETSTKPEARLENEAEKSKESDTELATSKKQVVNTKPVTETKAETKSESRATTSTVATNNASEILFRVQLAASVKFIDPDPKNFKGLQNIEIMSIDQYYKYFFGKTSSYANAKEMHREAESMGFKGCFITAFENGSPTNLSEAIKKARKYSN